MARRRAIARAFLAACASDDEDEAVALPFTDVMAVAGTAAAAAAACAPEEGRHEGCGEPDARVEGFVARVVPGYSDALFRVHFRMARPTLQVS